LEIIMAGPPPPPPPPPPTPFAITALSGPKKNFTAVVAPTVTDDETAGYSVGSQWVDTVGLMIYFCVDPSAGAAVWSTGGGGASDLESVLIEGNTTNGENIVLSGGGKIEFDPAHSLVLGLYNTVGSPYSFVFGNTNVVPSGAGKYHVAIGQGNTSGSGSSSTLDGCLAVGNANSSPGGAYFGSYGKTVAIGNNNSSTGFNSLALGYSNTASWYGSMAIGSFCTSSGFYSLSMGGLSNSASGYCSTVTGGESNTASNNFASAGGYRCEASLYGENAWASGQFSVKGDARRSEVVLRRTTTTNTPTNLLLDGSTSYLQYSMPFNGAIKLTVQVVAKNVTAGNTFAGFDISGLAKYTGASVTILGSTVTANAGNEFAGSVALVADSGNMAVQVTGISGQTIRWVAVLVAARIV
jgi:hypothetical protein